MDDMTSKHAVVSFKHTLTKVKNTYS